MAGAESRSRLWRRLGAGALSVAALTSGLWVKAAAADPTASLQSQAQTMAARLSSLDAQMARQDEALDQAKNRLAGIQSQLSAARSAVASAKDTVASDRQAVQQQAILAYVDGGSPSSLEQILQSSESSVAMRQSYLDSITANEQSSVDTLQGALLTLDQRQSQLQGAEAGAAAAVDQVRAARDASARAASAEQAALGQVKGRLADLVAQIDAQKQAAEQASFAGQSYSGASLPPPSGAGASLAVSWSQREVGKPYVYGAAGPDSFDCSGLTMYVWGQAGASLPHSAAGQWDDTVRVPISDLAPGDLVFYYQPVDHVGIYVGGGEMIVAPHTGTDVQYQSIFEGGLDGGGRVG
ncbi:MAG TPA: C40 family peptidase [Acidimicrobiales bacterium]|nr:C40 family peptidase [Acidimicrobiales bacterium]